ncbi:MAG: 4Fe-4S dicluster domain-containing protein [Elusimicrobia bacterium]|nr:4Fe-4S dicluster domain-containing protein [Elusimicrobiota bacterium]
MPPLEPLDLARLARELGVAESRLNALSRREFLLLSAGALLVAGAAACRQPVEEIVPYADRPEALADRELLWFASSLPRAGYGRGVLVKSFLGRPIQVEGNPAHPESLGAADPFAQAELLALYDPARSQAALRQGAPATRSEVLVELQAALERHAGRGGERLRVVTGTVTSPTLAARLAALERRFPAMRWVVHEPAGRENVLEGARLAFGRPLEPRLRLDRARVAVCLDADLFFAEPAALRLAREFADRREPELGAGMLRLYAAEPAPGLAGSVADHRLPIRAGRVEALARRLAFLVGAGPETGRLQEREERWLRAAASDLRARRGSGLVAAGAWQPPAVHALAHAINAAAGNVGGTVAYAEPAEARPARGASLAALAQELAGGRVGVLLLLGVDPAYDAPADLPMGSLLARAPFTAHLGLYVDDTAERCLWHLPAAHPLESWGDLRASDGTASIQQPLIAPLYAGWTAYEALGALLGERELSAHQGLRRHWRRQRGGPGFERDWRRWVHDGVVDGTSLPAAALSPRRPPPPEPSPAPTPAEEPAAAGLEAVFRPDLRLWDGRYARNAWLQELPDPVTKLTWDNAAWLSPADAERLGLANGDLVALSLEARTLEAPVWVVPGQAVGSVLLALGSGREGRGFSAYALRSSRSPWDSRGLSLAPLGRRRELACTQGHHRPEGREPARAATLARYRDDPGFASSAAHDPGPRETLYAPSPESSERYAWGMTVDLGRCIGCNACVAACQSENNIPVVGKDEVLRGREMHWLRVDRYYEGDPEAPRVQQQPLACVHCENAPCETVCPVEATVHSREGLNEMVYNRCVGTRYCSNNCPYKVRRFNFLQYSDVTTESLKLGRNPDVTVRNRGVMEKCTYCVQRIQSAKIAAERNSRDVLDGEVVTACQAACPTRAILFGNLLDPGSAVSRSRQAPRLYGLLAELGTRPRTRYLAKITNPHPGLQERS